MSKLIIGLTIALAIATAPGTSSAKSAATKAEKVEKSEAAAAPAAPSDKDAEQKLKEHLRLRNHIVKNVKYPATKEALVASFKNAKAIKADDKKWVEETLPSRIYDTSDDVIKALGWEVAPPQ